MTAGGLVQQLGLLGVFIAGAIPGLEAVTVTPVGIIIGLDPVLTLDFAIAGNIIAVVMFAYLSEKILQWAARRRERKSGSAPHARCERARRIFDRYGILGTALLGPLVLGTQFAAAVAVSFGVSPLKFSVVVSVGATLLGIVARRITLGIISI
ncbi:MAG: small multi-drug export protein [Actinomycetota bacterium]|nr:small multi-drug export protein [Actinomycetota bacterium]